MAGSEIGTSHEYQEPVGSISDHIAFTLKNISHIRTKNSITVPFNYITREICMIQSVMLCTKNTWTPEHYAEMS